MLKSLEQARLGFSLRLSWTAIGPDINAKFLEELGAIGDVLKLGEAIPLPINELISANPETITVPTMTSAGQTTDVAIDLASIPESQRQGASFTLDNSNVGFELKQLAGKLQLKRLTASDTGATIRINCSVPAAASAQSRANKSEACRPSAIPLP